jgi:NADH-quinone oxidoreductase subunit H
VDAEFAQLSEEPTAGGFPVPPLDLPHYHGPSRPPARPSTTGGST